MEEEQKTEYDVEKRRAKEERVRKQTESYARTWCAKHAKDVGLAFRDRKGAPFGGLGAHLRSASPARFIR